MSTSPFTVDELIARGAVQKSRKYRSVFLPPVEGCAEWLRKNRPEVYDRLVDFALKEFERSCANECWIQASSGFTVELSQQDFNAFLEKKTGKKQWTSEDKTPCPDCRSLGHMHRRDCRVRFPESNT